MLPVETCLNERGFTAFDMDTLSGAMSEILSLVQANTEQCCCKHEHMQLDAWACVHPNVDIALLTK